MMSSAPPSGFLAIPQPGETTLSRLQRKLDLLVLQRLLTHSGEGLPPAFFQLCGALPALARAQPAAVKAACANLDVRTGILAGDFAAALPPFLLALARRLPRGALGDTLLWDRPLARLPDRAGDRVLEFDPPAQGLVVSGAGAEVRDAMGAFVDLLAPVSGGDGPFHPLAGGAGPCLATQDTNPLAMLEDHPGKSGNAIDLGGRTAAEWCAALDRALEVIAGALPTLHAEMLRSVERIVPVGFEPKRHLSASYREAPGLVYLTLHPSALTMAEALIHESQHGKLNRLHWFDPLLRNGQSEWASSPVRPDLRPLHGVLMAVHAFVPVSALHARLAAMADPLCQEPRFAVWRAEVLGANAAGLATLREKADATALGQRVLDALFELHEYAAAQAPAVAGGVGVASLG